MHLLRDSRTVYSALEQESGDYAGWINNGGMFISRSTVNKLSLFHKTFLRPTIFQNSFNYGTKGCMEVDSNKLSKVSLGLAKHYANILNVKII